MNSTQRGALGHFFGYGVMGIGLLLSIYSAFHQFSFIQLALPANQREWGYLGILGFDLGMIFWAGAALYHARGDLQHILAWLMTAVSFMGVAAGLVMDTFLQAGRNGFSGKPEAGVVDTVIWVSVGVILLHIATGICYIALDPGHNERKRKEKLSARIESEAWKMSDQQVEILASRLAPQIAADQMQRLQARYTATLGHTPRMAALPSASRARQIMPPARPKTQPGLKVKMAESMVNAAAFRVEKRKPKAAPIYNPAPVYEEETPGDYVTEQPQFRYSEPEDFDPDFLSQDEPGMAQQGISHPDVNSIPVRHNGQLLDRQGKPYPPG